jgi:transposase-like protein
MSIMEKNTGKQVRPRRSFSNEFKSEVVELVRQPGNTVVSASRELELTETAVRKWVQQAYVDSGRRDGLDLIPADWSTRCASPNPIMGEGGPHDDEAKKAHPLSRSSESSPRATSCSPRAA